MGFAASGWEDGAAKRRRWEDGAMGIGGTWAGTPRPARQAGVGYSALAGSRMGGRDP